MLHRVSPKVEKFLSPGHSGFRKGRSTADVVWSHRWFAAACQRYHTTFHILGIDLSKAFDTIRRDLLMSVCESFLDEDELRMIRLLLANTSLSIRVGRTLSQSFDTTIGTPQGDSLSPVLFSIYLDGALREVRSLAILLRRPIEDSTIPLELIYADDTDFLSTSDQWLAELEPEVATILGKWHLKMNLGKTEKRQQ